MKIFNFVIIFVLLPLIVRSSFSLFDHTSSNFLCEQPSPEPAFSAKLTGINDLRYAESFILIKHDGCSEGYVIKSDSGYWTVYQGLSPLVLFTEMLIAADCFVFVPYPGGQRFGIKKRTTGKFLEYDNGYIVTGNNLHDGSVFSFQSGSVAPNTPITMKTEYNSILKETSNDVIFNKDLYLYGVYYDSYLKYNPDYMSITKTRDENCLFQFIQFDEEHFFIRVSQTSFPYKNVFGKGEVGTWDNLSDDQLWKIVQNSDNTISLVSINSGYLAIKTTPVTWSGRSEDQHIKIVFKE